MSKFEVYRDIQNQYRWRLVANNGEIVATSESYTTKQNAGISANNVKRLAPISMVLYLSN